MMIMLRNNFKKSNVFLISYKYYFITVLAVHLSFVLLIQVSHEIVLGYFEIIQFATPLRLLTTTRV